MTRILTLFLVACSGGGSSSSVDAPADHHVDAPHTHDDAPPAITSYSVDRITGSCDPLTAPTSIALVGLVHATDVTDLPASFAYFAETATRFSVAEQGYVMLFDASSADITTLVDPAQIPSTEAPNGFVAPLWEFHLSFVPDRSEIDLATVGDHAVIMWSDFAIGSVVADPTSHITMQVKLFADRHIEMHYCTLDPGQTTTGDETGARGAVGIESPDGTHGVSVGFDESVATTAQAIRFTPQ
jgi:hypothetical protein